MRIDFHYAPQAPTQTEHNRAQYAGSTTGSAPIAEDQAQLSSAHAQVQALASQAVQLPEVREERITALRQAVQNGQYRFDPENTAASLLADMELAPAR